MKVMNGTLLMPVWTWRSWRPWGLISHTLVFGKGDMIRVVASRTSDRKVCLKEIPNSSYWRQHCGPGHCPASLEPFLMWKKSLFNVFILCYITLKAGPFEESHQYLVCHQMCKPSVTTPLFSFSCSFSVVLWKMMLREKGLFIFHAATFWDLCSTLTIRQTGPVSDKACSSWTKICLNWNIFIKATACHIKTAAFQMNSWHPGSSVVLLMKWDAYDNYAGLCPW